MAHSEDRPGSDGSHRPALTLQERSSLGFVSFDAAGLGDRSYLVHDAQVGVVVDPQREHERYLDAAATLGVTITHVLETHVHNDYVSGGLALARAAGATYVLPEGVDVAFASECTTVGDGDHLHAGSVHITALWTPGHTPNHISYLFEGPGGGPGLACTGGSVLHATVGRTDLLGEERAAELAEAQWRSARRLLSDLDEHTRLLPTHGFGSFCSAVPKAGAVSGVPTVGEEAKRNPAAARDLASFVKMMLEDRAPVPAYYRYMAPLNRAGPEATRYHPSPRLALGQLNDWLGTGASVADLRARRSFAAGHRRGSLNIELGDNLTTYFGWVVPYEAPYVLVANDPGEVERARRLLARIGREDVAGFLLAADLGAEDEHSYPVATFADLSESVSADHEPFVLDIRHGSEWRAGHLSIAHHVALPDLPTWRSSLPSDRDIWVHCAAGFRAAIAASQLSGWGLGPVLVDDLFEHAMEHDLEVTTALA